MSFFIQTSPPHFTPSGVKIEKKNHYLTITFLISLYKILYNKSFYHLLIHQYCSINSYQDKITNHIIYLCTMQIAYSLRKQKEEKRQHVT